MNHLALSKERFLSVSKDYQDCRVVTEMVAKAGSSFYWGMRLLPTRRRAAMFAIYAFCRAVDDIVDEPGAIAEKKMALAEWRAEVDRIFFGIPVTPIGRQLQLAHRRYQLAREDFLAIIDGMEMDLDMPICAPSLHILELYCDRVAGAVGLLSVRVFGAPSQPAKLVSHHLGRALQLTNILRDLREDSMRGRLYLPKEYLLAAGIDAVDPAAVLAHPALPETCEKIARLAADHFEKAKAAMAVCPYTTMRPARIMMAVYQLILDRLRQRGWRHLDHPVKLSKWVKLAIVFRHAWF